MTFETVWGIIDSLKKLEATKKVLDEMNPVFTTREYNDSRNYRAYSFGTLRNKGFVKVVKEEHYPISNNNIIQYAVINDNGIKKVFNDYVDAENFVKSIKLMSPNCELEIQEEKGLAYGTRYYYSVNEKVFYDYIDAKIKNKLDTQQRCINNIQKYTNEAYNRVNELKSLKK